MDQQQLEQEINDLKTTIKQAPHTSGAIDACPWFNWDNTTTHIMTELDKQGFLYLNDGNDNE